MESFRKTSKRQLSLFGIRLGLDRSTPVYTRKQRIENKNITGNKLRTREALEDHET